MKLSFAEFIKGQLIDFVESYRLYFKRTLSVTVILSVISLLGIAVLFFYTNFDNFSRPERISLLNYFFGRYNVAETYALIDLTRIWFLLVISVFSVSLWRMEKNEDAYSEFSFIHFTKQVRAQDLIILILMGTLCTIIDFCLNLGDSSVYGIESRKMDLVYWFHSLLVQVRTYLPLLIFSFTINGLVNEGKRIKIFRSILFILVPFWLFNAVIFDFGYTVRSLIIAPLLTPFSEENRLIYESILAVALISFYFVGFYSMLTGFFRLQNEKEALEQSLSNI